MRRLVVLSIMMLVMLFNVVAQKTYIINTEHGLQVKRQDTLARFLGNIPEGVSTYKALIAYYKPGQAIVFYTNATTLWESRSYDEFGIWRTPIMIEKAVVYEKKTKRFVPQEPAVTPGVTEFAWCNFILMILLFVASFWSSSRFKSEGWIGEFIVAVIVGFIACLIFCASSPGSNIFFTISISVIICGIGLLIGYAVRKIIPIISRMFMLLKMKIAT